MIGRPTVMASERNRQARRMHDEGYDVAQIASARGVSRGTIYRHLGS